MDLRRHLITRTFGQPSGLLGRIGGRLMIRGKAGCGRWLVGALDFPADARILEIGCGPGVVLEVLARAAPKGRIVGVDPSDIMVRQAERRNATAIAGGLVELLPGEAEALPVGDAAFDVAVALNSVQLWRNLTTGLRECRRALRPKGRLCIGFTPEAGRPPGRLDEIVRAAGFTATKTTEGGGAAWTFATPRV